jgi:hypothetical protein
MREHPDIWKEWVAKYGVRGLGVGSKSKWMKINPQEYLDRSFKSREQFFWMRKNKPQEWLKILEEQGLPESLGLGSADKWILRGFEAESDENNSNHRELVAFYEDLQSAVYNTQFEGDYEDTLYYKIFEENDDEGGRGVFYIEEFLTNLKSLAPSLYNKTISNYDKNKILNALNNLDIKNNFCESCNEDIDLNETENYYGYFVTSSQSPNPLDRAAIRPNDAMGDIQLIYYGYCCQYCEEDYLNVISSTNELDWIVGEKATYYIIPEVDIEKSQKWQESFSSEVFEAYKPPQAAVNNAKRGLKLREKWGRGGLSPAEAKKQGIDSGVTRAKKIASGSVSRHDVRRMSAFNRHRKNYNPSKKKPDGGPTAGTIAWLLWGGTSGVDWAKKLSATMNAESWSAEEIKTNLPQHKVKTIQAGVEIITEDLRKPQIDMFNVNFLKGQLKAYQDFLNGIKITSGELVLEEISWVLSPKAEKLGERAYQANNEEMEHYYMGMIYGYDFILDLFGEFPADFQREMAADSIDIDIDFEDATLTRKEVKMAMWYPLIVGFIGGTLANIASNYFTVYYLRKREII